MNENYKLYRIWAPDGALWTQWAKPVLFSQARWGNREFDPLAIPTLKWAPPPNGSTAMIIDLPGELGVLEGLGLARLGYRPVPLYNGVYGPNQASMAVDVAPILHALCQGANQLAALSIHPSAPPVFLLDVNRLVGTYREPGKYDNRWCVFPQDMPSASFLQQQGIRQVYVRASRIQNDLTHILRRYQDQGIAIYHTGDSGDSQELKVVRPSEFRGLMYRFKTLMGLTRNAAGGFGGMVPEATQASGVHHHHYGGG